MTEDRADTTPIADTPEMAMALADRCIAALDGPEARAAFFDRVITRLLAQDHARIFWGDRLLSLGKSMGSSTTGIRGGLCRDPRLAPV